MSLWHLVIMEMRQRRLNVALALGSVIVAAGCLGGALTLLRAHDARTQRLLEQKETELRESMAMLEDDYRKITKRMGFNILILPKDQNLGDFYAEDFSVKTMPEAYVDKLATSGMLSIAHLMPMLTRKIQWEEGRRSILLTGVRDEAPQVGAAVKTPMQQPVPEGGAVLGAEIAAADGLAVGDPVTILGRTFKVAEVYEPRGNKDDITIWVPLADAQAMLGQPGLINGILALECNCAWANLPLVRKELAAILPDTQVIEKTTEALTRAEARWRAADAAREAVAREKENRAALRAEREALAAVLAPLAIVVAALWVGLLAWGNVRERREEIGMLRAIGLRARQVQALFLARAGLIGALGGGVGFALGWLSGFWLEPGAAALGALFDPVAFALTAALAPVVAMAAGWIPAQLAAQQDPAEILRGE